MASLPLPNTLLPQTRKPSGAETAAGLAFVAILAGWGFWSGFHSIDITPVTARDTRIAISQVESPQPQAHAIPASRPVPLGMATPAAQAIAEQARPPASHTPDRRDEPAPSVLAEEIPPPAALSASDATTDASANAPAAIETQAPPQVDTLTAPPTVDRLR